MMLVEVLQSSLGQTHNQSTCLLYNFISAKFRVLYLKIYSSVSEYRFVHWLFVIAIVIFSLGLKFLYLCWSALWQRV